MQHAATQTRIEPYRGGLYIDFPTLWHYRDLLFMFARLEYIAKVKQTILGPLWYILHPLITSAVFIFIFTKVVEIPSNGIPPLLFYLSGLLPWGYFSQCLLSVSSSLTGNVHLYRKVFIPRLLMPLSILISKLIPFVIQFVVFVLVYAYYRIFTSVADEIQPSILLLALPLYVLQMGALGLGAGLALAALSVRYRDLQHVVGLLIQLWMYCTPVFYPGILIAETWRPAMALNPMASIVEAVRQGFFGTYVSWRYVGLSIAVTLVVLAVGLVSYQRVEHDFVDTI